jgi:hypothetical protein
MQVANWMAIGKAKLKAMQSVDDADQYDAFDSEENKGDEDLEKQKWTQKAKQDPQEWDVEEEIKHAHW